MSVIQSRIVGNNFPTTKFLICCYFYKIRMVCIRNCVHFTIRTFRDPIYLGWLQSGPVLNRPLRSTLELLKHCPASSFFLNDKKNILLKQIHFNPYHCFVYRLNPVLVLILFEWSCSVYKTTDCAELQRVRSTCNFRPRNWDEPIKNYVKFSLRRRKGDESDDFPLGNPRMLFAIFQRRERKQNTCCTDRFRPQAVDRTSSQLFTPGLYNSTTSKGRKIVFD